MTFYMTEIAVVDWDRAVIWFRETLQMPIVILDTPRKFAMFGDDHGRISIVATKLSERSTHPRIVLIEPQILEARERLTRSGADLSEIVVDPAEPFQSFRIVGPEEIPITIFAWTDQRSS